MAIIVAGVALLVVAGVLLWFRRSQQSKLLEISSTETSTAGDLAKAAKYVAERLGEAGSFSQIVEVKGVIRCDTPLTSEIARQPCVYYRMEVVREREETYWETDAQSKQQVQRTRRASETVASNSQRVPFWVEDATGRVLVQPNGADIDAVQVVDRFEPGGGGGVVAFGDFSLDVGELLSRGLSGGRTLGFHFRESLLPLERRVYVLGEARDSSGELAVLKPREKGKNFLISLKSEDELVSAAGSAIRWLQVAALACAAAGVGLIVAGVVR